MYVEKMNGLEQSLYFTIFLHFQQLTSLIVPHIHVPLTLQLRNLEYSNDRRLYDLTLQLESEYANAFSFGFVGLAHKELYGAMGSDWHVFRVGLRFGVALVLLCWVLWNAVFDSSQGINLFKVLCLY